jgi:thiamine-phosphate pyrophosphorylase
MLISDCEHWSAQHVIERVSAVCAAAVAGSVVVQLRDRQLPTRERLALGRQLLAAAREHGQQMVVNERLDLALLLGADGVHLPEQAVPPAAARRFLTQRGMARPWLSCAVHQPTQQVSAALDAVVLSPILAPRKGRPALGLGALTDARAVLRPGQQLFALGGVEASQAVQCVARGADGVAVIGAVFEQDPRALLAALGIERG